MRSHAGLAKDFGTLLRQHRTASGMTQEELAECSRLSIRAIADMERGRTARPYRRSVERLALALGLSAADRARLHQMARGSGAEQPGAGADARAVSSADWRRQRTAAVPRQLPPTPAHFVGRSAELRALASALEAPGSPGRTAAISVIAGTAGVGKTALAVRWAHEIAVWFPDGQLYVNLRGFDPSGGPVHPAEALSGFLAALGVPPARIPGAVQPMAGLFRSLLATRKVLVLLDNARTPAQVRPLLPGNPACLVLVTSRNQLTGLAAADGAQLLPIDVLIRSDATRLLTRRIGAGRLGAEPKAADELIELCARLPLALGIVAARAAATPALRLRDLAADLREASGRLDVLDTGEVETSLRAMFQCSYEMLPEPEAQMFRLLGVHPGPDITVETAATLAGVPADKARILLRDLTRCHLASEHPAGRFVMHDLLRAYAAERSQFEDSA